MASAAKKEQVLAGMLSCWCWWGEAFPQGCGSLACKMCGVGAAWLSSAAQGAGKQSRPGPRAIFAVKERVMRAPCDGGTTSLCLTCLI